jgi:uncharacterized protein YaaN involved in tellurite resistance
METQKPSDTVTQNVKDGGAFNWEMPADESAPSVSQSPQGLPHGVEMPTSESVSSVSDDGLPNIPVLLEEATMLPLDKFEPAQRKQIEQISAVVSLKNSNTIETFGAPVQKKFSSYLDSLMEGIQNNDIGSAKDLILELSRTIQRINIQEVSSETKNGGPKGIKALLYKMPFGMGTRFSAVERFLASRSAIKSDMEKIEEKANIELAKLRKGSSDHDKLVEVTEKNLAELEIYLCAGQVALKKLREEFKVEREYCRQHRNDTVRLAKLSDMKAQIEAFETRMVRFSAYFTKSLTSIDQIRMAQTAGRIAFMDVMDTVLVDMPDMKRTIIQIAFLRQISEATSSSDARRATRRALGEVLDVALDTAVIHAQRVQGNFTQDIQALETMIKNHLERSLKVDEISRNNERARVAAMKQIGELRKRLDKGLMDRAERMLIE